MRAGGRWRHGFGLVDRAPERATGVSEWFPTRRSLYRQEAIFPKPGEGARKRDASPRPSARQEDGDPEVASPPPFSIFLMSAVTVLDGMAKPRPTEPALLEEERLSDEEE